MMKSVMQFLMVTAAILTAAAGAAPVVFNGGFEEAGGSTLGWRTYAVNGAAATFTANSDAYEGSHAVLINATAAPAGSDYGIDKWTSPLEVQPNEQIKLSFAAKKLSAGDTRMTVTIVQFNETGGFLGQAVQRFNPDTNYGVFTWSLAIGNVNTRKISVSFRISTSDGVLTTGQYLLDDVKFLIVPKILNGGFEEDYALWRGYAVAGAAASYTISSDAYQGSKAALMNITAAPAGSDAALDMWNSKLAAKQYQTIGISFAAKKVSGSDARLRVIITEFDSSGNTAYNYLITDVDPGLASYSVYTLPYLVLHSNTRLLNVAFSVVDSGGIKSVGSYLIDAVQVVDVQRVVNGGFEKGFDLWRYYAAGGVEASFTLCGDAYEGAQAALLNITAVPQTGEGFAALDRFNSKIGVSLYESMIISFAAKKVSGDNTRLLLFFAEYDAAGNYLDRGAWFIAEPGTAYQPFAFRYTVQHPQTAAVNFGFTIVDANVVRTVGSYLIDDVQVTPTQELESLWDYDNIDSLTYLPGLLIGPEGSAPDKLFEPGTLDGSPIIYNNAGDNNYSVEWTTLEPVTVKRIRLSLQSDHPTANRAINNFILKAKSGFGVSGYDMTLYSAAIIAPYPTNPRIIDVVLDAPVTSNAFRAEFVGATMYGPRIRELDAFGQIASEADLNWDRKVDNQDLAILCDNWLAQSPSKLTLENFESYVVSGSPQLSSRWSEYYANSFYGGQTISTVSLLTDPADVKNGTKAMRWNYDTAADPILPFTEILYNISATPVNIAQFDRMRVWINRHPGNSSETFYVRFFSGGVQLSNIVGGFLETGYNNSASPTGWSEWVVDLHNLAYEPGKSRADLASCTGLYFGVSSADVPGTPGTGVIDIDDIVFEKIQCSDLQGDLDRNCKVDLIDFTIFAENWVGL